MLKFQPFEAPASYSFIDPDDGYRYTATSRNDLITQIITYRTNNRLEDIEGLGLVVDNYLCSLPENAGKCSEAPEIERKFMDYMRGGVKLIKAYMFKDFAEQPVAEERASQCSTCPENVYPDDQGYYDAWADMAALDMRGERATSKDSELASCAVCSCVLKAKVFYKGKFGPFTEEQTQRLKAVNCWQLKEINGR